MPHIVHPDFGDIGFGDQSLKSSTNAIIVELFGNGCTVPLPFEVVTGRKVRLLYH